MGDRWLKRTAEEGGRGCWQREVGWYGADWRSLQVISVHSSSFPLFGAFDPPLLQLGGNAQTLIVCSFAAACCHCAAVRAKQQRYTGCCSSLLLMLIPNELQAKRSSFSMNTVQFNETLGTFGWVEHGTTSQKVCVSTSQVPSHEHKMCPCVQALISNWKFMFMFIFPDRIWFHLNEKTFLHRDAGWD